MNMKSKCKSLSIFEFQQCFPDEAICYQYLVDQKWKDGFRCLKCGNDKHYKGNHEFSWQCTKCSTIESAASGTLLHRLIFSILKAFYFVVISKKGIATTGSSRKLQNNQKTCLLFKQKVMRAMHSNRAFPMIKKVEVDEAYVYGQDRTAVGRNEGVKKILAVPIWKNGKGVSRMYGRLTQMASRKNLKEFIEEHISPQAEVKTDKWTGYKGLVKDFSKLKQLKSVKKGRNFPETHRTIIMYKVWLRRVHHSVRYQQAYINEYIYWFNLQFMADGILENPMSRMVKSEPFPNQKMISSYMPNSKKIIL
jgi:hypothetical protein